VIRPSPRRWNLAGPTRNRGSTRPLAARNWRVKASVHRGPRSRHPRRERSGTRCADHSGDGAGAATDRRAHRRALGPASPCRGCPTRSANPRHRSSSGGISLVWILAAGLSRLRHPLPTLAATGLMYALAAIVLSGILSPILTGTRQRSLVVPQGTIPVIVNAAWGAACGVCAIGLRRLRRAFVPLHVPWH
jgi:hypothetical protein